MLIFISFLFSFLSPSPYTINNNVRNNLINFCICKKKNKKKNFFFK